MRRSNSLHTRLAGAALAEAVADAGWRRVDLETRRPDSAHHELILATAAELATSPVARDQLLSLALERQARRAPPLFEIECDPADRDRIAARVFRLGPHRGSETAALVRMIEDQHARRLGPDARFDRVAEGLEQDAVLQECFWDHPAIPAGDFVRLAMLCSIPKLRDRAQELSLQGSIWPLSMTRWLARALPRAGR